MKLSNYAQKAITAFKVIDFMEKVKYIKNTGYKRPELASSGSGE